MTIELPYWAVIGTKILVKDYACVRGENPDVWYEEEIIGFGYDGVFHKAHNCSTYYTPFNQYGISLKLKYEVVQLKGKNE